MTFRYNAKSIFLTYSQCPLERETVLQALKDKAVPATNQLLKACIGRETHQDGNLHLHCCAWYTQPLQFSKADHFDILGYHPNIKDSRVGNKKKAIHYCAKEDPSPLQFNMDIKAETAAREAHSKVLTKRILDGAPLHQLVEEGEIALKDMSAWDHGFKLYKRHKKDAKPDLPSKLPNPWQIDLRLFPLRHKQRHYWIWSREPNRGKTTAFL